MAWRIELTDAAVKALKKIDPHAARRITRFLQERLAATDDPRTHGSPLRGELRTYWRYRVGPYRLICHIEDDTVRILVIRISHRKEAYR